MAAKGIWRSWSAKNCLVEPFSLCEDLQSISAVSRCHTSLPTLIPQTSHALPIKKDAVFNLGWKIIAVYSVTSAYPHRVSSRILSLNAGDFSTCFERLTPTTSFKSKSLATCTLSTKPLSSACSSTSSRLLRPPQSGTNLSTGAAASHSPEQASPEPGSLLLIYISSREDASGVDRSVVLLTPLNWSWEPAFQKWMAE